MPKAKDFEDMEFITRHLDGTETRRTVREMRADAERVKLRAKELEEEQRKFEASLAGRATSAFLTIFYWVMGLSAAALLLLGIFGSGGGCSLTVGRVATCD